MDDLEDSIKKYLKVPKSQDLRKDVSLEQAGIDSVSYITLLDKIEEKYGFEVAKKSLDEWHTISINDMMQQATLLGEVAKETRIKTINLETTFEELGFDSLNMVELTLKLEKIYDYQFSLDDVSYSRRNPPEEKTTYIK